MEARRTLRLPYRRLTIAKFIRHKSKFVRKCRPRLVGRFSQSEGSSCSDRPCAVSEFFKPMTLSNWMKRPTSLNLAWRDGFGVGLFCLGWVFAFIASGFCLLMLFLGIVFGGAGARWRIVWKPTGPVRHVFPYHAGAGTGC